MFNGLLPLDIGDSRKRLTRVAPVWCPTIDILLGSPPNSAIFSRTQTTAASISFTGRVPDPSRPGPVFRKPATEYAKVKCD